MPCSQSWREEFIERRIKGREEKERGTEREAEICLPLQRNGGKRAGVGGACLLEGPLPLRTIRELLTTCRGPSAAPQTLHLRLKGHQERGDTKSVKARGPRQMP